MGKRKKLMTIIILIVMVLLMISCAQRENGISGEQVLKNISLEEAGAYRLEDYREFGLWSLTIEKEALSVHGLTALPLTLRVTGNGTETFEINRHKVDHGRYICFIPEHIEDSALEAGTIWSGVERAVRNGEVLGIEKVIIDGEEIQNGTNLYEMFLTDYITLKASETSRIYTEGKLIRPKYVKTAEENLYDIQRYYNARQASAEKDTQSALEFLKDRTVAAHTALLYFGNPNRLTVTPGGGEEIDSPDERERLRQLGAEGETEVYSFSQDGANVLFKIWSEKLTNDQYKKAGKFFLAIRGLAEPCELLPTGVNGIYEGSVNWVLKEELARNARFTSIMPFAGGTGTESDPYQIADWKQLNNVRDFMASAVHFKLITDLSSQTAHYETYVATQTTPGNKGWEPIGTPTSPFLGMFSGFDGTVAHTITDLIIDRPYESNVGLFGRAGTESQGATILYLGLNDVKVKGCFLVGGLAGYISSGTVRNVFVSGNVSGETGTGGLAGQLDKMNISNTYTTVNVTGDDFAGGFTGAIYYGTYSNVYTAGRVACGLYAGAFAGDVGSGTFNNAFWDKESSGKAFGVGRGSSAGITEKTTAEMKKKETFTAAGWDFDTVWTIVEGPGQKSYPYLRDIPQTPPPGFEKTFEGGTGMEDDPYQIADWEQLNNVRDFMASDVHFVLITDLSTQTAHYETYVATQTTPGNKGWEPIGTMEKPFRGTLSGYDGQATHTIADLIIDRPDESNVGLFGQAGSFEQNATITSLGLENVKVTGNNNTGSLAGALGGSISYVTVSGAVSGNVTNGSSIGGVAGFMMGDISQVCVTVSVKGNKQTGGVIGSMQGDISRAYVTGSVTGDTQTGGVVGSIRGDINLAYVTVSVKGNSLAGGLVGTLADGTIRDTYVTGTVSGDAQVGGFAGNIETGSICNSYTTGVVSGNVDVGGFIGKIIGGTITHSFWDTQTSEQSAGVGNGTSTGITGKTTSDMKKKTTFTDAGWDFDTVWTIVEGSGQISYPYLKDIPQTPPPGFEKIFEGGTGTESNPYQIADWEQLNNVRNHMGADVHFILITDLSSQTAHYETYVATQTTADNAGWEPIGIAANPFLGTFSGYDGQATHTITDLIIERPAENEVGLFGYVGTETQGATITHLGLENVKVKGRNFVGGLAADMMGTINHVYVTGTVTGHDCVGGL
ncbi:MAG TPA: hypothetical protein PLB99_13955, partial [Thermotogota bacterium]|nr:hypothetical protein [Thermotogota bacterium]